MKKILRNILLFFDELFYDHQHDYMYYTYDGRFYAKYHNDIPFGKLHRIKGPALIYPKPCKVEWYQNGKLHRIDEPAIIDELEYRSEYYFNGLRHRLYGPALTYYDDNECELIRKWFIHDVEKTEDIEQWIKDNNLPHYEDWDDSIKLKFRLTWS